MPSYFIACDNPPVENANATRLQCNYSNGAIAYTEQEVSEIYSPPLTAEDAWLFAGAIYMISFFSWGFRLLLKFMNIGV